MADGPDRPDSGSRRYRSIAEHYEQCFRRHGPGHLGVDWPNADDATTRYAVMLDVIRPGDGEVSLLDFGCGSAGLLDHIRASGIERVDYSGHDISAVYVEHCRAQHPGVTFTCGDVLDGARLASHDYVIANGVFTEKLSLSNDEMFRFFSSVVQELFRSARVGLAFNVMSTNVDWEREDLFHLAPAVLIDFVTSELSRSFTIRQDYGLYEYTTYVYK